MNGVAVMRRLGGAAILGWVISACAAGAGPGTAPVSPSNTEATAGSTTASSTAAATAVPPASRSAAPILSDDAWLVYAWYPDVLWLVRPDGTAKQQLDIGVPGVPFAPAWSFDGRELVFVLRGDAAPTPNGAIWTSQADGSGAAPLYDGNGGCPDGAFWPSWSPDGKRLAMICYFINEDGGWTEVSVVDPVTKARTALATLKYPSTVDNPPSWSPDGSALTFEIITWDPTDAFVAESVIATVPTAGGEVRKLTEPGVFAGHPDWSPDGTRIAFSTYDTGNIHGIEEPSNVYVIAPDGTGLRQLSTASVDGKMRLGQPFWSPDGARIWVSVARDWERDADGQFKNTLGWVDAATGAFTEVGTDGKRFRERPTD